MSSQSNALLGTPFFLTTIPALPVGSFQPPPSFILHSNFILNRLDHPDQDFRKKLDPDDQESPEDDLLDQLFWKKLDQAGQF
ncbi:MAG: hypothetical protein AB7W16_19080 [Candidatus Obscuribacterales bacterium]